MIATKHAIRDEHGYYNLGRCSPERVLHVASAILAERMTRPGERLTDPNATREFLRCRLSHLPHEVFHVIYLDNRNRVIAFEELFRGTYDGASVYPRELVKRVLEHNAASVILAHNHPSGAPEPSMADRALTTRLSEALRLVDVRILDHFVVGHEVVSFAERGYI